MRAEDESENKRQEKKSEELTSTSSEMWSVSRTEAERALSMCRESLNAFEEFLEREAETQRIFEKMQSEKGQRLFPIYRNVLVATPSLG